jgi:hypothetical protein
MMVVRYLKNKCADLQLLEDVARQRRAKAQTTRVLVLFGASFLCKNYEVFLVTVSAVLCLCSFSQLFERLVA